MSVVASLPSNNRLLGTWHVPPRENPSGNTLARRLRRIHDNSRGVMPDNTAASVRGWRSTHRTDYIPDIFSQGKGNKPAGTLAKSECGGKEAVLAGKQQDKVT